MIYFEPGKFVIVHVSGVYWSGYGWTTNVNNILTWNEIIDANHYLKYTNGMSNGRVVSTDAVNHKLALMKTRNSMWSLWGDAKLFTSLRS